jgi:hypothetical protein
MIYSVWNPVRHVYVYHRGPDLPYGETPTPKHLTPKQLGVPIDHAAWPLPSGTQKIGEGREARGMVASGDVPSIGGTSWLVIIGLLAAGYGLNKVLR